MIDTNKSQLLAHLDALRSALEKAPPSPVVSQALHQCGRLQLALQQWHAEGFRFAAFTLNRLMQQPGANFPEDVQAAARNVKEGIDAAGFGQAHS